MIIQELNGSFFYFHLFSIYIIFITYLFDKTFNILLYLVYQQQGVTTMIEQTVFHSPMDGESVKRAKGVFGSCKVLTFETIRRGKVILNTFIAYTYKGIVRLIDTQEFECDFGFLYALTDKDGVTKNDFKLLTHGTTHLVKVERL